MPRDTRSYDEMHARDMHPNQQHKLLKEHFPLYNGLTEVCKAMMRCELERYPLAEFQAEMRKYPDNVLGFARSLIEMHMAFGVEA